MRKAHVQPTVEFSFQTIPLEEARTIVLAGEGNYSLVKRTLLERLPELQHDQAFVFGLPGGKEVPEQNRRGLCMAVNATLKKAKLNWRITYSSNKKMFICIPKNPKVPKDKQVIAPKRTRTKLGQNENNGNGHNPISPAELITTARLVFNYKGDFKDTTGKAIRKAISVVGMNDLGIHPKDVGPLIGLSRDGVYYNAHNKTNFAQEEIKALQKAVQQEG